MREDVANFVFPVLTYGLRLRERLAANDAPDFRTAQKELLGLMQNPPKSAMWDAPNVSVSSSTRMPRDIRYPLVCWLDEVFIVDSPWKAEWTEHKLEQTLYGTNDRAWKFWEEAKRTESFPTTDALETFYLCVMLGFRGELFDKPEKLRAWREAVDAQLARTQEQEWPDRPVEVRPKTFVPPLLGVPRRQRMFFIATLLLLLAIPLMAFFVFYRFLRD